MAAHHYSARARGGERVTSLPKEVRCRRYATSHRLPPSICRLTPAATCFRRYATTDSRPETCDLYLGRCVGRSVATNYTRKALTCLLPPLLQPSEPACVLRHAPREIEILSMINYYPMPSFSGGWLLVLAFISAGSVGECLSGEEPAQATAEATAAMEVDFNRDLAPLFSRNCVACHNAKKAEGGLNLESFEALEAGGDSGAAVVPDSPDESYLLDRVIDSDDPMPPADNAVGAQALTAAEVDVLRRWIELGAQAPAESSSSAMQWQPIPEQLSPIYALAHSSDGNYLAIGRGNTAQVLSRSTSDAAQPTPGANPSETPSRSQALIDNELRLADGAQLIASHLDLVQSLAFSPDSQLLATGGYRTVKLWRRETIPQQLLTGLSAASPLSAFTPTGKRLALVIEGHGLELVDMATNQTHRFLQLHSTAITALVWLSETQLLTIDATGQLAVTDAVNYQTVAHPLDPLLAQTRQLLVAGEGLFVLNHEGKLHRGGASAGLTLAETLLNNTSALVVEPLELPDAVAALAVAAHPEPSVIVALRNHSVTRLALAAAIVAEPLCDLQLDAAVQQLAVSPDGHKLLTIDDAGQAKLWRSDSGELIATLDRNYDGVLQLRARQRDATRQAGLVELLAAQIPELQAASTAEEEARKKAQEVRDQAATALTTKETELAAAENERLQTEQALAAAQAQVTELTAQLEAKQKAKQDVEAKRMEAEMDLAQRDQALATAVEGIQRAAQRISDMEAQVASEREVLASVQADAQSLEVTAQAPAARAGTFGSDGQAVVIAGDDPTLRMYDARDGAAQANLLGNQSTLAAIQAVEGDQLLAVNAEGRVLNWDLKLPWSLQQTIGSPQESPFSDRITALDFSPDGKLLAVGSGPPSRFGEVQLIDVSNGTIAKSFGEVHSDSVLCIKFSPDGRQLASGGADKLCRLWSVASGDALRTFEGHTHHVLNIAWQDNGQRLATASADQTIKVWKVDSGEQQRTIAGFSQEVSALQFVGDTPQMVSAANDGSVKLLNTDDGQTVRAFAGASDALYAITVSADNQRVTVGGQAGVVWSWNIADAQSISMPSLTQATRQ